MVIALLSLVGVFIALYLTLYKVGIIGELTCTVGSCETVNTSRYALFVGLPVAAWGLGAYVVLFALAIAGLQPAYSASRGVTWAILGVAGWSVLFSGWLTYLELFVIHAICMWCVTSAVLIALIFVAALADVRATGAAAIPPDGTADAASEPDATAPQRFGAVGR